MRRRLRRRRRFDDGGGQIGFARVISDRATFAYLDDVFVLPQHRRRGIATGMIEALFAMPELARPKTWLLFTRDMQSFYRKLGFDPFPDGIAMARSGRTPTP